MSETDFEVGGHKYRLGKLNAFQQLHVVRKLLPLVSGLGGGEQLAGLRGDPNDPDGKPDMAAIMGLLGPGLEAFAHLPNDDVELIVNTCLGAVRRNVGGDRGWGPIMSGAAMMYDDIDLVVMLQLVWRVLEAHLDGFFHTFRQMSQSKGPVAKA